MGKQVKTPRFYVDIPTFLHAVGYPEYFTGSNGQAELLYMNPSNQYVSQLREQWAPSENTESFGYQELHRIGRNTFGRTAYPINFCAYLNHNYGYLSSSNMMDGWVSIYAKRFDISSGNTGKVQVFQNTKNILNSGVNNNGGTEGSATIKPEWNGTSIFSFDEVVGVWNSFNTTITSSHPSSAFPEGGFTDNRLRRFYENNEDNAGIGLGSMVIGKYWDAPNSPDLELTMSRRFDGIKKQKTIGGKTLANIYYDGPTEWSQNRLEGGIDLEDPESNYAFNIHKYPPFELDSALPSGRGLNASEEWGEYVEKGKEYYRYRAKSGLGRKGLRSWNLTFSYISEDDMWMAYEGSSVAPFRPQEPFNVYTESDVPQDDGTYISSFDNGHPDESDTNPMLSDNSFNFVWNCTLGGTLPFIFQPDKDNNNPDQFSICTFRQNTLSVKQVAYNTYTLSVTIDEVA